MEISIINAFTVEPERQQQLIELLTQATRQVDLVIERMVQCVLDGAGKKLALQVNRKKTRAGAHVL